MTPSSLEAEIQDMVDRETRAGQLGAKEAGDETLASQLQRDLRDRPDLLILEGLAFELGVVGKEEAHVYAAQVEFPGKRPGNVGEASGLGQGSGFRCGEADFHR